MSAETTTKIVEQVIEVDEHKVRFLFVRLGGSFLLWIGDSMDPTMDSLALALGKNATEIMATGDVTGDGELATRLSARFNNGGPVYVSLNYQPAKSNLELKLEITKKLVEFVAENVELSA